MVSGQNKNLEMVAHFLAVNSEALSSNGLDGKMPLLNFLFQYGQNFKKQHYTDFAFEILEECVTEELIKMQSNDDKTILFDLAALEMGWSLQKFISMDFFETDETNEILSPFDKMALSYAQHLAEKNLLLENVQEFVFMATYLNDRLPVMREKSSEYLVAKQHLVAIIEKIQTHVVPLSKEAINPSFSLRFILDEIQCLLKIDNFSSKLNISRCFVNAIEADDIRAAASLKLWFPEVAKVNSIKEDLFWDKLNAEVDISIKALYENDKNTDLNSVLKIVVYASLLFKNTSSNHLKFLAHSFLYSSQENNLTV